MYALLRREIHLRIFKIYTDHTANGSEGMLHYGVMVKQKQLRPLLSNRQ